jgi:hypothetical protein
MMLGSPLCSFHRRRYHRQSREGIQRWLDVLSLLCPTVVDDNDNDNDNDNDDDDNNNDDDNDDNDDDDDDDDDDDEQPTLSPCVFANDCRGQRRPQSKLGIHPAVSLATSAADAHKGPHGLVLNAAADHNEGMPTTYWVSSGPFSSRELVWMTAKGHLEHDRRSLGFSHRCYRGRRRHSDISWWWGCHAAVKIARGEPHDVSAGEDSVLRAKLRLRGREQQPVLAKMMGCGSRR